MVLSGVVRKLVRGVGHFFSMPLRVMPFSYRFVISFDSNAVSSSAVVSGIKESV